MTSDTNAMIIVTSDVEPEHDEEMHRWYKEEHFPALLGVPGYHSARLFVALDGPPQYMSMYEVDSLDVRKSDAYRKAIDTPWSAKMRTYREQHLSSYEQLSPAEGFVHGPAWNEALGAMMVLRTDCAPENEADFNAWYDEEHINALCSVPGVISARRLKAVEGGPGYLAQYNLVAPEVQTSAAWLKAIDTPWSARARGYFLNRLRLVYVPDPSI